MTTNDMTAILAPKENFRGETRSEEKYLCFRTLSNHAEAVAKAVRGDFEANDPDARKQNASVFLDLPSRACILNESIRNRLAEMHKIADAVRYGANFYRGKDDTSGDVITLKFTVANLWQEGSENEPAAL